MKKRYLFGLLAWNTLLTVIIGYGAYEFKNGYNLLMYNLEGLVKISKNLHEHQEVLEDAIEVTTDNVNALIVSVDKNKKDIAVIARVLLSSDFKTNTNEIPKMVCISKE